MFSNTNYYPIRACYLIVATRGAIVFCNYSGIKLMGWATGLVNGL